MVIRHLTLGFLGLGIACTPAPAPTAPDPSPDPPGVPPPDVPAPEPISEPAVPEEGDGTCSVPADCEGQNLVHIQCVGKWTCPDGQCAWDCSASKAPQLSGGAPSDSGQPCTLWTGGPRRDADPPAGFRTNPCPNGQQCVCNSAGGYSCSGTCQ